MTPESNLRKVPLMHTGPVVRLNYPTFDSRVNNTSLTPRLAVKRNSLTVLRSAGFG